MFTPSTPSSYETISAGTSIVKSSSSSVERLLLIEQGSLPQFNGGHVGMVSFPEQSTFGDKPSFDEFRHEQYITDWLNFSVLCFAMKRLSPGGTLKILKINMVCIDMT
jgi:hypothetical protein